MKKVRIYADAPTAFKLGFKRGAIMYGVVCFIIGLVFGAVALFGIALYLS